MKKMESKGLKNPAVMGIVLGTVIVGAVVYVLQKNTIKSPADANKDAEKNPNALDTVEGGTRQKIMDEIQTPEPGAESFGGVAVPKSAVSVGEEVRAAIRTFEIRGEGGKYVPSTIVVDELDIVEIELRAVDQDYDISLPDFGIVKTAKKGSTETIQFQAYPYGEYAFQCKDACSAEGKLIVNQRES